MQIERVRNYQPPHDDVEDASLELIVKADDVAIRMFFQGPEDQISSGLLVRVPDKYEEFRYNVYCWDHSVHKKSAAGMDCHIWGHCEVDSYAFAKGNVWLWDTRGEAALWEDLEYALRRELEGYEED